MNIKIYYFIQNKEMVLGALRLENMLTRNSSAFQASYKETLPQEKIKLFNL
jgi:hypothetical protein